MKTIIAIPCMDMVHTAFMRSLLEMEKVGDVVYEIASGSLVYDARNRLLKKAIDSDVDRIFWLDSDMTFPKETMQVLSADIEAGCGLVSALAFKRRPPYTPNMFRTCDLVKIGENQYAPTAEPYLDYPSDSVFEVAAMGGACAMMDMGAIRKIVDQMGFMLFMPVMGFGEDLSFSMRARKAGVKMFCDSRLKIGHVGMHTYTEDDYLEYHRTIRKSENSVADRDGRV